MPRRLERRSGKAGPHGCVRGLSQEQHHRSHPLPERVVAPSSTAAGLASGFIANWKSLTIFFVISGATVAFGIGQRRLAHLRCRHHVRCMEDQQLGAWSDQSGTAHGCFRAPRSPPSCSAVGFGMGTFIAASRSRASSTSFEAACSVTTLEYAAIAWSS